MLQLTCWLAVPATEAVNCWACPPPNDAPGRLRETDTGVSVMLALADLLESAELVAVTVAVCGAVNVAGAVYRPDGETLPAPDRLQATCWLVDPVTLAVSCRV